MLDQPEPVVALVILEDQHQRIALQLRDDLPHITWPNMWSLFGGLVEKGEQPEETAVREIYEELTITLDPQKLIFLHTFHHLANRVFYLFHYPISYELAQAMLTEGQGYQRCTPAQIQRAIINNRPVAPPILEMLAWYWQFLGETTPQPDPRQERLLNLIGLGSFVVLVMMIILIIWFRSLL